MALTFFWRPSAILDSTMNIRHSNGRNGGLEFLRRVVECPVVTPISVSGFCAYLL